MKKSVLLFFTVFCVMSVFAQKNILISGGFAASSMVCANNEVYVTGSNKTDQGTGTLGTGSSADYVPNWTKVPFPAGIEIQQVNSGRHNFVALDCNKKVWCWGDNTQGQCGQGTIGGNVTTPMQVNAGVLAGTVYECGGFLCNVDVVYSEGANTFALLGDGPHKGKVVAWGGNGSGGSYASNLGDGTNTNRSAPVWCLDLNGNQLTNITQIYTSDDVSMFLDANGHVWTAGGQHYPEILGRLATGGYAATSSEEGSPYFGMVYVAPGVPLSNIKQIAAGDVNCQALDGDGYVWGWGDAWNSACGIGQDKGSSFPMKVIGGLLDDEDTDGAYLLAKSIGAGQSCGFAVTLTGKPVMWGQFANGAYGTSVLPRYVARLGGVVDSDVILINKGDTWGFYERSNGDMYTWGYNGEGQLGTGNTANLAVATAITPPTGCETKDPSPSATITPKSMLVCESSFTGVELNCGFVVSSADLIDNYKITWYRNGTQVSTGNGSNALYTTSTLADGIGTYKVRVEYVGDNSGCEVYIPAEDEITISAYEQDYTVPALNYCGATGKVHVVSDNPTAVYNWGTSKTMTNVLGTTIGSAETSINVSGIASNASGQKTVYVQQIGKASGDFLTTAQLNASNLSGGDDFMGKALSVTGGPGSWATGFEVKKAVDITSIAYFANTIIQGWNYSSTPNDTLVASANITVTIYGATQNNGKWIPNASSTFGTLTGSYVRKFVYSDGENGKAYSYGAKISEGTVNGKISLPAGIYYIAVSAVSAFSGTAHFQEFKLARESTTANTVSSAMKDTYDATYLTGVGVASYGNGEQNSPGLFHNIKFTTGMGFCDVIAVPLTEDCPCNKPDDITLTVKSGTTTLTGNPILICDGTSLSITTNTQSSTTDFSYLWYKDGTATTAATTGAMASQTGVTTEGVYKVVFYDKTQDLATTSCKKEASVTIDVAPKPTIAISGGGSFCKNETITPVTFTFTGTAPFTLKYAVKDGTTTTDVTELIASGTTFSVPTDDLKGGYTYTYSVTSLTDANGCAAAAYATTKTIQVKSFSLISSKTLPEVCEGDNIEIGSKLTFSVTTGTTYSWTNASGFTSTDANPVLTDVTVADAGEYTITTDLGGCKYSKDVTVTINAKPVINTLTADDSQVCSGSVINLTATTSDAGAGTPTWSTNVTSSNKLTATVSKTVTSQTKETITLSYKSAKGCVAADKTIELTFDPIPDKPVVADLSYCLNATTAKQLTATASAGCTLQWYGTNSTGGTPSTTGPTPSTTPAVTTSYYVSQKNAGGCESGRAVINVKVNSNLSPVITLTDNELCIGETSTVSTSPSYSKTTWSGSATANFDNTALLSPKFTAPSVTSKTDYTVTVVVEDDNTCTGTSSATISVYPTPTITLTPPSAVCSGTSSTVTASVVSDPATGGTYVWSSNVSGGTATSATYSGTATGTVTYDYTSSKGCKAIQKTATVTINPIPVAPTTVNTSYCLNTTAKPLSDQITLSTGTLNWYGTNATGGTASSVAPTPSTKEIGETIYYVSQLNEDACESERSALTVEVVDCSTPEAPNNSPISVVNELETGGFSDVDLSQYASSDITVSETTNIEVSVSVSGVVSFSAKDENWVGAEKVIVTVADGSGGTKELIYVVIKNSVPESSHLPLSVSIYVPQTIGTYGDEFMFMANCYGKFDLCTWEIAGVKLKNPYSLFQTVKHLIPGSYTITCTLKNSDGDEVSDTKTINVYGINERNLVVSCKNDSFELTANVPGVWSNGESGSSTRGEIMPPYNTKKYSIEMNIGGAILVDSVEVKFPKLYAEKLGVVTHTEERAAIVIAWEKTTGKGIKSYRVERETSVTNYWETVEETTFSKPALVVDYSANIAQRAYRYRLVSIDSCGREAVSEPHKSMHLVVSRQESGLPFLLWNAYEPNDEVLQYLVLRKDSETMQFETLDQVPAGSGTVTWSETDVNTKNSSTAYRVAFTLRDEVNETAFYDEDGNETNMYGKLKAESGPFVLAISNIAEVENGSSVNRIPNATIVVYPTQVQDNINIAIVSNESKDFEIELISSEGQIVYRSTEKHVTKDVVEIPMKTMAQGVYMVRVSNGEHIESYKVVK